MTTDECPTCDNPSTGGQIVELLHPFRDDVTYAVVCGNCNTVYRSPEAREQIVGERQE